MASFSLQVFLLLSAPFRRRHGSRLLNGSLWVAYLMADYVATYILGRLTLLLAVTGGNEGRRHHQLALFWAPFLLLHLGGQETITAFSMEDNTLWKRRLLDLIAQVAMSVYVVGKHGGKGIDCWWLPWCSCSCWEQSSMAREYGRLGQPPHGRLEVVPLLALLLTP